MAELKWLQNGGNYYYFKDAPTHASGITLNKNSISLTEAGQQEQLVATITPSDAIDKSIIWTSSNTSIATVNPNGLVTCVTPGSCTITASCDGVSASCSVKMRKTFTVSWTETSDPTQFNPVYSDDAVGLTAGSTDFDEFFGYSAVRLDTSGNETAEITQTDSGGDGKLDITQLGTLTSGDNVMIKFPVRGIKMSKSGGIVTLSITDGLNRESEGFQYYAHCTGTLSSPGIPKDAFYLGTYKAYNNSSVLKSWSGKTPTGNQSITTFCTRAKANGSGYNIIGFYQRQYINAFYMMKYGNPNSQSVIGQGYTGGSSAPTTGGTDSQDNATYGTSGTTTQVKLFGLEDWWGGINEWVGGMYTDGNKQLCTMLSNWSGTVSGGEGTGTTLDNAGGNDISSIAGNNKAMFAPIGAVSNSNYDTYYSDYVAINASRLAYTGGNWTNGANAGAFLLTVTSKDDSTATHFGSRLMFL